MKSRWFKIFFITIFAYASGFLPVHADNNLFLRNVSLRSQNSQAVQGSATTSARQTFLRAQIQEINIGVKKSDSSSVTTQPKSQEKEEWGMARQLDTYTWTIKVSQDARNATAQEILSALNSYRQKNGRGTLSWDEKLGNYAQERASYFISSGNLDSHAGFTDYLNNHDGFHKLGFMSLGENSSLGYILEGVHLIEWVYAGDKPHNDNQLSSDWSHVGIGVSGNATDLVFGGKKL